MTSLETPGELLTAPQETLNKKFKDWCGSFADRYPYLRYIGYHPQQSTGQQEGVYHLPAFTPEERPVNDSLETVYEVASKLAGQGNFELGKQQFEMLISAFRPELIQTLLEKVYVEGANIAVVTPHTSLVDAPFAEAGMVVAVERYMVENNLPEAGTFREKTGILMNQAMSGLGFKDSGEVEGDDSRVGLVLTEFLREMGAVDQVIPVTESSVNKYRFTQDEIDKINPWSVRSLLKRLRRGNGLIEFIGGPGTMAVKLPNSEITEIPRVNPTTAKLLTRFDYALPVIIEFGSKGMKVDVGELQEAGETWDVHAFMCGLASRAGELSEKAITYENAEKANPRWNKLDAQLAANSRRMPAESSEIVLSPV